MIYNIVELIQLTDMAILRLLRNHNQRLIINKMLGLKSQIKGQLRYEFVIYMDELVIQKHPDGKTVCLAGDQVPARRTAKLDLLLERKAPDIDLSQNVLLTLNQPEMLCTLDLTLSALLHLEQILHLREH